MPVILGGDITAYSLARSFYEQYSMKSLVVSLSKHGLVHSSFIHNVIQPDMEQADVFLNELNRLGNEHQDKKLILLACGDWYVRMIIENKQKFTSNYIIPYIDRQLLDQLVLKHKFYEICDSLGMDYPQTVVCDPKQEIPPLPFGYPVIAKPTNSAMYHYAVFEGKRKVFRFDTQQEMSEMFQKISESSYQDPFLVQDCIPGDDTAMRILTCYSDRNAKVQFAAFGRVLLEDHGPNAIGNPIVIMNDIQMEVAQQAITFLEHTGYTGFSNFDLKYDIRDGTYQFFEINPRLGRSNYYITASGFNVVKWIVDDLIYHKELEFTVADQPHLYTVVPRSVILDYLQDDALKAQVVQYYRDKKVTNPIQCKQDKSWMHKLYFYRFMRLQKKKYHRYKGDAVGREWNGVPVRPKELGAHEQKHEGARL